MKLKVLKHIFKLSFWRALFHLFRSLLRQRNKRYAESIEDLEWILVNPPSIPFLNLVHEELGINYAYLKDFERAIYHLLKALEHEPKKRNGLVCMWLGYVYLVIKDYNSSIEYFKKAQEMGQNGYDKLVVDHEYVKKMISRADERLRMQFTEVLPDLHK